MTRSYCKSCERLQQNCLCHLVKPIDNHLPVLFLQHPLEKGHIKNTARLAHLCLKHSRFEIGEQFDPLRLKAWLGETSVLLYPPTQDFKGKVFMPQAIAQDSPVKQLVVLDGTWKKTLKMLHLNPLLSALPRLALSPSQASQYEIRKQKNAQTVSTLEAVAQALSEVEISIEKYQPMQKVLRGLVEQQLSYRVN